MMAWENHVLDLQWENLLDKEGNVTSLGKKFWALYVVGERLAEGFEVITSIALASSLFDVPEKTIERCWYTWLESPEQFVLSLRGKHAKQS